MKWRPIAVVVNALGRAGVELGENGRILPQAEGEALKKLAPKLAPDDEGMRVIRGDAGGWWSPSFRTKTRET